MKKYITLRPDEKHLSRRVTVIDGKDCTTHKMSVVYLDAEGGIRYEPFEGEEAMTVYHDNPLTVDLMKGQAFEIL